MNKAKPKFSLKDQLFNKEKIEYLSKLLEKSMKNKKYDSYQKFNSKQFIEDILTPFPTLGLKERVSHISNMLKKHLPEDYKTAVEILLDCLPDEIITKIEDDNFWDFIFSPFSNFVAKNWCKQKYLEFSLDAIENMTTRFSAEDSIRDFINRFEGQTLKRILKWSKAKNYHLRRLASESTRPKLPWAKKINLDYKKTIKILDNLYFDSSRYVTRSVANHLNDIAKIDSDLVIETLDKWQKTKKSKDISYIISHSTRSLVKKWDKKTLEFLWYSNTLNVKLNFLKIENCKIRIWENLIFEFEIESKWEKLQKLIIDYLIYFKMANWRLNPKVFKISKKTLQKWEILKIKKKHPLKIMTTKKLYEWNHKIELQINWNKLCEKNFDLMLNVNNNY